MEQTILGELIYYAHKLSPRFKQLLIIPISDVHYGNPLFSALHFRKTIRFIKDTPNAFGILNGDLIESNLRTSKGDIYKQVGTPQDQMEWIIKELTPIKKKLLGMTTGNHEGRIYDSIGFDVSKEIASVLEIPYRPVGMLLKISFGLGNDRVADRPFTYFIYFTHGYGGARTKAAKAVKVERLGTWVHADAYIMAHDHVVNVAPDVYLMPDPRTRHDEETGFEIGTVKAHRKMLIKSNAYLKFGGYSEMGGFPPVDLEIPIIKLAGTGKPRVSVEV